MFKNVSRKLIQAITGTRKFYYRFTRYSLERMLSDFSSVIVEVHGSAKMSFSHFMTATKATA